MEKVLAPVFLLSLLTAVLVLGSMSPALADSENKSYKRSWAVPIGEAEGTIEVSPDADIDDVRDLAISEEQALQGYDVDKARLTKAVNDSGQHFLVWKLVDYAESNAKTIHVLDAGTGEQLIEPIVKEGGSCGSHKMTGSA